jgi:ubiquinone/menaquinone biosynthesis C-methylase UbiE
MCSYCASLERHRLLWLFFQRKTDLFSDVNIKMLHIAAEPCFESRLKKVLGKNYITADLYNPSAMVKMDIMDIKYPDETFDIIICNHVLEHVADDIKAMKELHRVVKKGGRAFLLVPVADMEKTYEDASITTPEGRLEAFGQDDHVRKYGRDYIDRIKSSGFMVDVFQAADFADSNEMKKMKLKEQSSAWGFMDTEIFYCTK